MPRQARIDIPGALHHIIGRGIERRLIFSKCLSVGECRPLPVPSPGGLQVKRGRILPLEAPGIQISKFQVITPAVTIAIDAILPIATKYNAETILFIVLFLFGVVVWIGAS